MCVYRTTYPFVLRRPNYRLYRHGLEFKKGKTLHSGSYIRMMIFGRIQSSDFKAFQTEMMGSSTRKFLGPQELMKKSLIGRTVPSV